MLFFFLNALSISVYYLYLVFVSKFVQAVFQFFKIQLYHDEETIMVK